MPVIADILFPEDVDRGLKSRQTLYRIIRNLIANQPFIAIVRTNDDGTFLALIVSFPRGEERPIGDIVEWQAVPEKDDVVGILHGGAQVPLHLVDERRWPLLEAALHDAAGVLGVGRRVALMLR